MNDAEFRFIKWLLKEMEDMKNNSDRNKFCVDFDNVYERRKELYKEYTGKDWRPGQ